LKKKWEELKELKEEQDKFEEGEYVHFDEEEHDDGIITPEIFIPWYKPCGEALFIMRPETKHEISITTPIKKYEPGSEVDFEV